MTSKFDIQTIISILNKSNGHCWYCGKELTFDSRYEKVNSDTFAVDHIIPTSLKGTDKFSNLVPACFSCNTVKQNHSLEEFRVLRSQQVNGVPYFSEKQLTYLLIHGITLPTLEPFIFYFEEKGLTA